MIHNIIGNIPPNIIDTHSIGDDIQITIYHNVDAIGVILQRSHSPLAQ